MLNCNCVIVFNNHKHNSKEVQAVKVTKKAIKQGQLLTFLEESTRILGVELRWNAEII